MVTISHQKIIKALAAAIRNIERDRKASLKIFARLETRLHGGEDLNFEEIEQHDYEEGFSSAMRMALHYLMTELSVIGLKL